MCNPSTWEVEAGQEDLKFETSLGYIRNKPTQNNARDVTQWKSALGWIPELQQSEANSCLSVLHWIIKNICLCLRQGVAFHYPKTL
jgi:hypothetical protein